MVCIGFERRAFEFIGPIWIRLLSADFANASSRALSKSTFAIAAFNNSCERSISAVTRVVLGIAIVCEWFGQSCRLVGWPRRGRCEASTSRSNGGQHSSRADLPPAHHTPFVPALFSQQPETAGRWRIGKRRIWVNTESGGLIAGSRVGTAHQCNGTKWWAVPTLLWPEPVALPQV